MILVRSKSLLACILSYGAFNAVSAFSDTAKESLNANILSALTITDVIAFYAVILLIPLIRKGKGQSNSEVLYDSEKPDTAKRYEADAME